MAFPDIFENAFIKNTAIKQLDRNYTFYPFEIGKIKITSGHLIACDPIVMYDGKPFIQNFPIGQFPVQLAIAKINTDERVGFSRILFSDCDVNKWEFALKSGQEPIPLIGEKMYCYGVDAGVGLFIDEHSNTIFNKKDWEVTWQEVFIEKMHENYRNTWAYIVHEFDGHNFASFSTGYGDGCYSTYIGYDIDGKPCRLLTDFALVNWWEKK